MGIVDSVGLRFTTLVNLHGQKIYVPNRTIGIIGRIRNAYIRAYVDVQITENMNQTQVVIEIETIAKAMTSQFDSIILSPPENMGLKTAEQGAWKYLHIKFKLWPGQGSLIEGPFKQRLVSEMEKMGPDFADWMITVVYKTE